MHRCTVSPLRLQTACEGWSELTHNMNLMEEGDYTKCENPSGQCLDRPALFWDHSHLRYWKWADACRF